VNDTFPVLEDSANNVLQVLLNDYNFANQVGGANLEITAVSTPANGNVVITGNATTVSYTPVPNFFGTDTFTYTIVDTTDPDDISEHGDRDGECGVGQRPAELSGDADPPEVNEDAGPQTLTELGDLRRRHAAGEPGPVGATIPGQRHQQSRLCSPPRVCHPAEL
jgi:hypothetical protein